MSVSSWGLCVLVRQYRPPPPPADWSVRRLSVLKRDGFQCVAVPSAEGAAARRKRVPRRRPEKQHPGEPAWRVTVPGVWERARSTAADQQTGIPLGGCPSTPCTVANLPLQGITCHPPQAEATYDLRASLKSSRDFFLPGALVCNSVRVGFRWARRGWGAGRLPTGSQPLPCWLLMAVCRGTGFNACVVAFPGPGRVAGGRGPEHPQRVNQVAVTSPQVTTVLTTVGHLRGARSIVTRTPSHRRLLSGRRTGNRC